MYGRNNSLPIGVFASGNQLLPLTCCPGFQPLKFRRESADEGRTLPSIRAKMNIHETCIPTPPFSVLAVDDSVVCRKLIEQCLAGEPYPVIFARNGMEAIRLFQKSHPSVVITDWTMPDITGLELCQRIRTEFPDDYCHVIMLTSNADKENVVQGLAAGADDYLTKPFHSGELLARIGVGRRMAELHAQIAAKNRQLEMMALTDALTGLPNRRAVDVWAPRALSAASRHSFPLWVIVADLDHFKRINDTFGHDAGDAVLVGFAEILKANTRQSNMCARIGGEEFLLLLTHSDETGVTIAIERLRKQLEERDFVFKSGHAQVTASFGICGFLGGKAPCLNDLIIRADAALYHAKHGGRNRIEFAGLNASCASAP